ncbi:MULTISPECIES: DUF2922 domain-containing protein [Oceanobacillus]|uniref:DUF2922 domain-containing protein n=1 Tax=Oceanobacillus indicireducens TaxID=1004261 RepID=A0A917Y1N0_9BACI|nr:MULTISPECIES: DUF2922 domain-containing protein [Oceanobacillus]MCF3942655.1 DUF2922 domain-containing protein [Oceanobacillus alkalisoli]MCG5102635.1 DUF2922 domain-containing protein [Oceanobacillus alkalisoli]GGN61262.1 hypothetical protein GCM10007971_26160 [Oceanobacillus indicireducens]
MKRLQMQFENQEGKVVTYTLDDPVEPIDHEAVNEAMDTVIAQNAFNSSGGELVAKRGARVVEQITEEIEIY